MAVTVVGLYPTPAEVEHLTDDLKRNDFPQQSIHHHDEAGPNLKDWLVEQGVPEQDAEDYVRGVRAGARLVTVEAPDERADEAVQIMQRHERAPGWVAGTDDDAAIAADTTAGTAGTTGATTAATTEAPPPAGTEEHPRSERREPTRTDEHERAIPVVEEELEVGKRATESGGVRVRRYVTEQRVEEQVPVREERVHVERRPADRKLAKGEAADAFQDETVEMTEHSEEVVVSKRPRVIEEVVLSKEVDERVESVSDTVRRTDVDVERTDDPEHARATPAAADTRAVFARDRDHYRVHHRDTFGEAPSYEDAEVAYRFGIDLAHHPDYAGHGWSDVSHFARERWEQQNSGTWSEFEPAVRYGYERASDPSRY